MALQLFIFNYIRSNTRLNMRSSTQLGSVDTKLEHVPDYKSKLKSSVSNAYRSSKFRVKVINRLCEKVPIN